MEQRIFHGSITPEDLADALIGEFNRGNLQAKKFGSDEIMVVQITSKEQSKSGGQTAMTVSLRSVEDGVAIQIGKQTWMGVAASLGQSALFTLKNPWNLLWRLDDIAQDIKYLQLSEDVWELLERTSSDLGATFELSERLRRLACAYCFTANPVGEPSCVACGAPLGESQPKTCKKCGFVTKNETNCPNCGNKL